MFGLLYSFVPELIFEKYLKIVDSVVSGARAA